MALKGIRVIEIGGLAPAPFCGAILADFGATVIKIDKAGPGLNLDSLNHGKKSVALNLKHPEGKQIFRKLCKSSDVLIEPFRKGVMEKLNLGPKLMLEENPRLIYARLSGFGQSGYYSNMAGHDINYIAISGLLSMLGGENKRKFPPLNFLADFAGGSVVCALGIFFALYERINSGLGQVIDANMVEGVGYVGSMIYHMKNNLHEDEFRKRFLSKCHYFSTYETKDNKFMAVGSIEPSSYIKLLEILNISPELLPQVPDNADGFRVFQTKLKEKTREEWERIFEGTEACVTPVLTTEEAMNYAHNCERKSFVVASSKEVTSNPSPRLSRTPAATSSEMLKPEIGFHTEEILKDMGYEMEKIDEMVNNQVVHIVNASSKL